MSDHPIRSTLLRTGIVLRDALPWNEEREIVETTEDAGYEAVFVPEIDGREAFATLTGFAAASTRLRLGTGVVTVWARSPLTTAMAASTVQDLSGGRMILGLGAGSPSGIGASVAGGASTPLRLVEEFVRVVREATAGGGTPVAEGLNGDPFRAAGFVPTLRVDPFPIWIAALGDGMVSLGGRVADGILLNWCPPERVVAAKALVVEAAEQAGRDPDGVTMAVYVRACLGVDQEQALPPLRAMTGMYASIPHYRKQLEAVGLGELAAAAAKAMEAGTAQDVPEELVRALTIIGGRDEALTRFDAYRQAGADVVLVYPVAALDRFSSVLGTVLTAAPDPAIER